MVEANPILGGYGEGLFGFHVDHKSMLTYQWLATSDRLTERIKL